MIVSMVRAVGRATVGVFDEEDRQVIRGGIRLFAQGILLTALAVAGVVIASAAFAVAISVFEIMRF